MILPKMRCWLLSSLDIFIGRQPIFDSKGNIYAYELLYRNSSSNEYPNIDPEKATIELLIHTFLTVGIDQVAGRYKSFINFSEKFFEQGLINQLDPNLIIIEILENTKITPLFIERVKSLRKLGFKFALDDYVIEEYSDLHEELFKLVHFIKVDFLHSTTSDRLRLKSLVKKHPHITLLAEKIETMEQYEEAKKLGYLLFQGYFFAEPEIIKSKDIPLNYPLHMRLLHRLNEPEPDIDEISMLIMHDLSLSYKLLRYINSLAFGIPEQIKSIKQAVMLMGLNEARRWLRILLLHHLGDGQGKGRERALVDISLTIAKICELLAKYKKKPNSDEYFLTGMFSLLNVILKRSWDHVLPKLSLSDEIANTLRGEETELQPYLRLSDAIVRFSWDEVDKYAKELEIPESELSKISIEAHKWANQFK